MGLKFKMTKICLLLLPLDILAIIFRYLKTSDLRNVMLSCKYLRDVIINETLLWRAKTKQDLVINFSSEKDTYSLYNRCRISHNWQKGIFKNKVIIQHNTNYMPWLKFHDSKTLFLSIGAKLQCYAIDRKGMHRNNILWSITVPTVKRDDIRTNDISRFILKSNLLACGNRDGCVAVFDLVDYTKKPELLTHIENCHQNGLVEVSAVEIIKDTIVTVSNDSSCISFWKLNHKTNDTGCEIGRAHNIFLSEVLGCRCVAANTFEDHLAIGLNGNSKPLLLDVTTSKLLISPDETMNIKQVIRDVQWQNENTFVYVSHSGKLEMLDIRIGRTVYETTDPFQSSLYCVKTDSENAVVVGSSEYSRCVLYDIRHTHHVQMYFTQKKMSPIYSLDFDTSKLISAVDRGVAILNFNVNAATTQPRDYSHAFECIS